MADGKVTAHIGCLKCGTVVFEVVATPTGKPGVFQNQMRPRAGTAEDADRKTCGECKGQLSRVSAP